MPGLFNAFETSKKERTGTAEDTGDLDELNGLLAGIHLCVVGGEKL